MIIALILACTQSNEPPKSSDPQQNISPVEKVDTTLVIYSGRGEALVDELLKQAATELELEIEVQYGSTSDLVTRLLTEGDQSPADVIFAQDSGHLGALAQQKRLQPLSTEILNVVPPHFQDENGLWVGTSGRLRTLVYDSSQLNEDQLPQSLKELSDPKWKGMLGWAPSNSSFQAHVSALRHLWGEEETKTWLEGVQSNAPAVYPKNSPQVKAADAGQLKIGWVNHYYLHKLGKADSSAKNFSFPQKDAGNIVMLAGAGVTAHSTHKSNAERLIGWLLSENAQNWFAQNTFEYPTRPGILTHSDVPALNVEWLADVKQEHLSDIGPTRQLLQSLGIQ